MRFCRKVADRMPFLVAVAGMWLGPVAAEPALLTPADAAGRSVHHLSVDANVYPWSSVGKIFNSVGGACTGFVVAPDKVLTAGHCVYAFRTRKFLPPDAIHFLLGYERGQYRIHPQVVGYRLGPGYDPTDEKRTASADWALLDLAAPLPASVRPLAARKEPPDRGTRIMIGGFARDRAFLMTGDTDCRILDSVPGGKLLSHDCLTAAGDSGAPLLASAGNAGFVYLGVTIANWRVGDQVTGIAAAASAVTFDVTVRHPASQP
jgi:protease YdgD